MATRLARPLIGSAALAAVALLSACSSHPSAHQATPSSQPSRPAAIPVSNVVGAPELHSCAHPDTAALAKVYPGTWRASKAPVVSAGSCALGLTNGSEVLTAAYLPSGDPADDIASQRTDNASHHNKDVTWHQLRVSASSAGVARISSTDVTYLLDTAGKDYVVSMSLDVPLADDTRTSDSDRGQLAAALLTWGLAQRPS